MTALRTRSVRPRLETLEDRLTPSTFQPAGPATHFQVILPHDARAGSQAGATVIALDAANRVATGYTGTVHLSSSDGAATLPDDYKFKASDHGVHRFSATFLAIGSDALTVADTHSASIAGSATTTVHAAPAATHFQVVAAEVSAKGEASSYRVVALDASNRVVDGYVGTVHFTSSDGAAVLPGDYTFTAANHGSHRFQATFQTLGAQTIKATDKTTSAITGMATTTVAQRGVATRLVLEADPTVRVGEDFGFRVKALDAFGKVATGYTGTVHFSSTDGSADLPTDFTFRASDHGVGRFTASLDTKGTQSLTVADTMKPALKDSESVRVLGAFGADLRDLLRWFRRHW